MARKREIGKGKTNHFDVGELTYKRRRTDPSLLQVFSQLGRSAINGERKNRGEARQEKAKELLWANLTKGRSGIPGPGVPSDWSMLTGSSAEN